MLFIHTKVTKWNSTKLCHMFGKSAILKVDVKIMGFTPLTGGAQKLPYSGNFATTYKP